jgi:hypothetical protein
MSRPARSCLAWVVALVAACFACASPALASPAVGTQMACWIWGAHPQPLPVVGSDFQPGTDLGVAIAGKAVGSWRTDSDGRLTAALDPPKFSVGGQPFWAVPRPITVQVVDDPSTQPRVLASMQVPTVWQGSQLLIPGLGRSRTRAMGRPFELQAGGEQDGQTFYLHYAFTGQRHHLVFGTFPLGATSGQCGTLDVSFDLFRHVRPHAGYWNVWSDTLPRIPRALEHARFLPVFTLFKLIHGHNGAWIERFP